ncbi:MAG: response regulator [Bacteroidales bacterium]|nr:response regulator [Bacteroidales bacterium]
MKILVADDSKLILSLISSLLKTVDEHCQVLTAINGAEAIEQAEKEKPDLILMDWQMPTLSGIEALKKIKETPHTQHIPVIMLTASENTAEAFQYGATDFIQKPFQKEEFLTRVRNIMAASKASKESEEDKIKNEWLNLEIERDRLRNLKETLIKQKKEITQVVGKIKSLHQKYYIESSSIRENLLHHFLISYPMFDIPSHMLWVKRHDNQNICIAICLFKIKGIPAFLSAFNCEKILESTILSDEIDINSVFRTVSSSLRTELGSEFCFCLLRINTKDHILSLHTEGVPLFLFQNNEFKKIDSENAQITYSSDNILYAIQNGFLEQTDTSNSQDVFIEYFQQHGNLPFDKQKATIEDNIRNWQRELRQVNDIMVLGLKLAF